MPTLRMIGEFLQWQQEFFRPWKPGERILVILARNRLTGFRKYGSGPNDGGMRRERLRKDFVGIIGSLVDQQEIDRNDLRL